MELTNLFIEGGLKTPEIDFNTLTGDLILSGRSIPENAGAFYSGIIKWVQEYAKNPRDNTNLRLNLHYFNSTSTIWFAKIVRELCTVKKSSYTLIIHLYFDMEDFEEMHKEDLADSLGPIISMIGSPTINIGIRIYGTGSSGEVLKESMVFI